MGTAGMAVCRARAATCPRSRRCPGVVDLQVAEAEIGEGLEDLRALAHDVGEGEVGALGAVQRGDLAVGIEQIAHPHGDRLPRDARGEVDPGAGGVDGAEVGDDGAVGQRVEAHRQHRRLLDVGALRVRVGERRRAGRSDHRDGRPGAVVVAGARPAFGVGPPVDPLHEVADVGVALGRGQPFGRGSRHVPSVPWTTWRPSSYQSDTARMRPGDEAGRPWPGPYQRCRTPRALAAPGRRASGEVDGADVLLVGVGEARPGVDGVAVDVEAVGVGGGDVGGGPLDRAGGRGDVGAQVGDPVGLGRGAGRFEPLGRGPSRWCGDR